MFIDSWILQPERIDNVCNDIDIGIPTSEVFKIAEEYNLRLIESRPIDNNLKYITLHGGSFNIYICEITHNGNRVIKKEFKKTNVR